MQHQHTNQWQSAPISARNLDIYRVILELMAFCKPLIPRIARFNKRSGNQLKATSKSTHKLARAAAFKSCACGETPGKSKSWNMPEVRAGRLPSRGGGVIEPPKVADQYHSYPQSRIFRRACAAPVPIGLIF